MQHHTMWQTFIRGGRIIWLAVGALLLLLILRGGANEADQALLTALVKIYAIGSGLLVLLAYLGQSQRMTAGAHSLVKAAVLVWVGAGVLLMGLVALGLYQNWPILVMYALCSLGAGFAIFCWERM